MDQKTISWVSYITLIGWIIALVSYNSSVDKSSLARFHLGQSLGIMLTAIIVYIIGMMAVFILSFFGSLIWVLNIGVFILWILGLIAAVQGEEKPVPVLGSLYQKTLTFIS